MIYQLSQQQMKADAATSKKIVIFALLFLVVILVVLNIPTIVKGQADIPLLIMGSVIGVGLTSLGMVAALSEQKKKKFTQIETKERSFVRISKMIKDEIQADSILQLVIPTLPNGALESLMVKAAQRPLMLLKGFENMEGLAKDLEGLVKDPSRIVRTQKKTDKRSGMKVFTLVMGGILGGSVLVVGLIWLFAKLGLGFLAMPLCIIIMGASRFTSNRWNRKERMAGVGLIFLGVIWAVAQFFFEVMNRGK